MIYKQSSSLYFLGALYSIAVNAATPNCPLLGPDFQAPTNLCGSTTIQNAKSNLTQILNQAILTNNSTYGFFDGQNTSFSLEIFSLNDLDLVFEQHHTAPAVITYSDGTQNVDTNTTYRIGSLTKLMTVYSFLIQAGDVTFNEPVTKYVPELEAAAGNYNATEDPIDHVAWEEVTIGDLASQLADIGRDYSGFGELSGPFAPPGFTPAVAGLPPLDSLDTPICLGGSYCDRANFFRGFLKRHPVYAPSTNAIYSNAAYLILSYALENMTGIDMPTMVQDSLLIPLNLSSGTSWMLPPADNSTAIIPDGGAWGLSLGDETAAGGMYATPSDLVTLGRSILSSKLIKPSLTRRWMKPRSFVSSLVTGVGAPWEILRSRMSPSNRVVDLYTKSGDIGSYASLLGLIPDWDLGFIALGAGDSSTKVVYLVSDMVVDTFLPAVEAVAREEADSNYSGTYSNSDPSLNSSVVITTDPAKPGLGVTSWINNGTDVLTSAIAAPSIRLYPTGLKKTLQNGDTSIGYRAIFEDPGTPQNIGLFSLLCQTWTSVDGEFWGGVATDEFLITVDRDGIGKSVTPRITREVLLKENSGEN